MKPETEARLFTWVLGGIFLVWIVLGWSEFQWIFWLMLIFVILVGIWFIATKLLGKFLEWNWDSLTPLERKNIDRLNKMARTGSREPPR